MTVDIDDETHTLRGRPNVTLTPDDWGGLNGIRGTGPSLFGITVPPYFHFIIKRLEELGYSAGHDLFGAPYDWRFGAAQPNSYFDRLRDLVEQAYRVRNESVVVVAHSLGSQLVHRFLTEQTTPEWRARYINSTTLIAPSWSGSGHSFNTLWRIQAPILAPFGLSHVKTFTRRLGTLHIHLPHVLGYQNVTLFSDPDGNTFSGSELMGLLVRHSKIDEKSRRMAEQNWEFLRRWPAPLDVKTHILYNSGIRTSLGLNLTSWKGFGTQIYGDGDGVVGSAVIDWVCQNWSVAKGLVCRDVKSPKTKHIHKNLLFSEDTIDVLIQWMLGDAARRVHEQSRFWAHFDL
jgi:lecithin-cholesterol acyltransferase